MITHDMLFFSYAHAPKRAVSRLPQWLNAQANQARFPIYWNKPSIALVSELGWRNVVF